MQNDGGIGRRPTPQGDDADDDGDRRPMVAAVTVGLCCATADGGGSGRRPMLMEAVVAVGLGRDLHW